MTQKPVTQEPLVQDPVLPSSAGADDLYSVAEDFASVAQRLHAAPDFDETLDLVCRLAVERVPLCRHAAVSTRDRHGVQCARATDPVAEALTGIEAEAQQGPALDAIESSVVVEVGDLLLEDRWPLFASRVVSETGLRAVMSFRLQAGEHTFGALSFYSETPGAFAAHPAATRWGRLYAAHAALALAGAQTTSDLRQALQSRETISVAVGILVGRQGISRADAFDVLRRASQRTNRKLRHVAAAIAGSEDAVTPDSVEALLSLVGGSLGGNE
jgi:hypothetical protein